MADPKQQDILLESDLQGCLPLIAKGKVRDLYAIDDTKLLLVSCDRISAYDVIMKNVSRLYYQACWKIAFPCRQYMSLRNLCCFGRQQFQGFLSRNVEGTAVLPRRDERGWESHR